MSQNVKRILIINKDGGCTYTLNSLLNTWGYHVATVNTFIKSIEFCLHNSFVPHLIIVGVAKDSNIFRDYPEKVKARIKKHIPIVAYTHLTSSLFREEALAAGYKDCLVRPVMPQELRERIEYLIDPRPQTNVPTPTSPTHHTDERNEEALLLSSLKIKSINNGGIECHSLFPLPKGIITEVQSSLFNRIGIKGAKLSVEKTEKVEEEKVLDGHHYLIKLKFINLDIEQDYKLISFLKSQNSGHIEAS